MATSPFDKFMHAGAPDTPYETANGARAAFDSGFAYSSGSIGDQLIAYADAVKSLNGTTKQVNLVAGVDGKSITIGTPQDIDTTSDVTFKRGTFTGQLQGAGTILADDASAGQIGEFQDNELATPGNAMGSTTTVDICSKSLTAGDWDVQFMGVLIANGVTITAQAVGCSLQSATLPLDKYQSTDVRTATVPAANMRLVTPVRRVSISAPTTVYGVMQSVNGGAGVTGFGYLRCRRVR